MARNPFIDTKLEYELEPVLWFSQRSKRIAERGKSTFISGTRGSGKTSILRSLSTHHISQISSLNEQLSDRRLEWFGVYIRLQDAFADVLNSRPFDREDIPERRSRQHSAFTIFSQYVELLMLSALSTDMVELRDASFLRFSAGSEYDAVQRVLADSDVLRGYADGQHLESLRDLSKLTDRILARLFEAAISTESRYPQGVFRPSLPGEIITTATKCILPIIRSDRFRQGRKLRLKLMIDDCEVLPLEHQVFLNTLIRNTSEPISWVIAYVGNLYDSRRTVRPNQMLSDADRELESLDEVKEAEFKQLCVRITSLRLYRALEPDARRRAGITSPNDCFSLTERLGKISLNSLIEWSLDKSISDVVQKWRDRAREWQIVLERANLPSDAKDRLELRDSAPPYTIAVAAFYLGITLEEAERELQHERGRRGIERRLARKQRAAFLVIGRETGTKMLLAGESMVIALSDSCIRDFLDFMREIFDREVRDGSEGSLFQFVRAKTPISPATQSVAIYAASEAKLRGVMTIADPYGVDVTRLIEALGQLTAEMQTGDGAIRNPELGIFRVHWPRLRDILGKLGQAPRQVDELFRKSELDGFVREVDDKDRVLFRPDPRLTEYRLFRLHRRFAPAFGFSFRGPYGEYNLPESAFVEVLVADNKFSISEWVRRTLRGLDGSFGPGQLELPGLDENNGD